MELGQASRKRAPSLIQIGVTSERSRFPKQSQRRCRNWAFPLPVRISQVRRPFIHGFHPVGVMSDGSLMGLKRSGIIPDADAILSTNRRKVSNALPSTGLATPQTEVSISSGSHDGGQTASVLTPHPNDNERTLPLRNRPAQTMITGFVTLACSSMAERPTACTPCVLKRFDAMQLSAQASSSRHAPSASGRSTVLYISCYLDI